MDTERVISGAMGSAERLRNADGAVTADVHTDQYLTFMLADEEYGVDILRVQEIKGWDTVTHIPNTPDYMKGVLNLRGTIVPIIDLRARFGLERIDYGPMTVIIVVRVESGNKQRTMGIVVDGVSDVYDVPRNQLQATPDFGGPVDSNFIKGIATLNETMVILLDVDFLLNSGDLALVAEASRLKESLQSHNKG